MVKILTVLMAIVAVAGAKIIEYPFTNDYYFFSDTIHVTTTDTKFFISSDAVYELTIINDSAEDLISIRLQQGTNVSTIGTICNAYSTHTFTSPVLLGVPIDSIWVDCSGAATIYIEGWEVK